MPNIPTSSEGPDISLAEMIESLRRELQSSVESGKGQAVTFDIEKVELEVKIAVSRKAKGEGGVAFWIVKAGANLEAGRDTTHTFKLTLTPVVSASGARLRVSSSTRQGPARG